MWSSLVRNAVLYLATAAFAVLAGYLVVALWPAKEAFSIASTVLGALVSAVVYATTFAEFRGMTARERWLRVLDRSWAVIIIEFLTAILAATAIAQLGAGTLADEVVAIPILLVTVSLFFADVDAVINDDERWWMIVPTALARSLRTTWSGGTLRRAILLFALAIAAGAAFSWIEPFLIAHHVKHASFWANVPLGIIATIPLNVLSALVYLDAIGYERKEPLV